jgi:glycosyltransferase involved in cell wall biosynthesis
MFENVCDEVSEPEIFRPRQSADFLDSDQPRSFVLVETQHCKIPPERWLEALSKGDFFLACPGVGMPLCHNLVEAMAAGAIPILQYAAYLSPELKNGENCLTFDDERSLREVTSRALAMTEVEVLELRRGTKLYYDENLAPGRFAKRLLEESGPNPTLLINSYRVPR